MNIENKIAVVTGGTKGIGRAIAESLLKNGASVFICARDKSELKRTLEELSALGKVDGEVCDVRSEVAGRDDAQRMRKSFRRR